MSPEAEDRRHARLRAQLPYLFTAAQLLTPDPEQAAEVVATTYRRALGGLPLDATEGELRSGLFREMIHAHDLLTGMAQAGPPETPEGAEARAAADRFALQTARRQLADALLDRAVIQAFVMLPRAERLLVFLCDAEGMDCAEAAPLLSLSPDLAAHRLQAARQTLRDALHERPTPTERRLIAGAYPDADEEIGSALSRALPALLSPVPASLEDRLITRPAAPVRAPAGVAPQPPHAPLSPLPSRTRATAKPPKASMKKRLTHLFSSLLIIVVAGMLGFAISSLFEPEPPEVNLVTLSAARAEGLRPTFRTVSPEQAERFVLDRLGRRLTLPDISDASLLGAAVREITPGLEVPAFLFENNDGTEIILYAYSYALLDLHQGTIELDRDILRQIESDQHFDIHDLGIQKVLVWRNRDDIFLAVTTGDPETLRSRIYFPS